LRGCRVDFLHVYHLPSAEEVMNSKIPKILERFLEYCFKLRLYLVPFKPFWDKCEEMPERMRLVLWRAYLFNIADRIAKERGYLGIVTGDNLG